MAQVNRLLVGTALALVSGTQAFAQESAPKSTGLEEIVVTAQRRSENLQQVPIAITAVTGSTLENASITDTGTLTALVPSMTSTPSVGNTAVFLRGVGTLAIATENSIATYIDGVYMPAQFSALMSLNNVDRIEVLKGPQGTLFGRNATGGVINVITREPGKQPTLKADVSYGNYNTVEGTLYGSTPLSDTLAADIALYGMDQKDGWGDNLTTGKETGKANSYAARTKFVWTPTDATKVTFSGDISRLHSDIGMSYRLVPGAIGIDGSTYQGFYKSTPNVEESFINKAKGVSLRIDQDFDAFRVASITSYRKTTSVQFFDQDGTALPVVNGDPLNNFDKTFTQELQLLSPAESKLQWIVGGFFMDNKYGTNPIRLTGAAFGPATVDINVDQSNKSYAGFAQATYEIMPKLKVTAGARYTKDKRQTEGTTSFDGVVFAPATASQEKSFSKVTFRGALDYQFTDDVLGYASFNRGFKSGTYNLVSYAAPPVRPEVLDAYEVGLKTELFDRRLRVNTAAFFYDYKDIQIQQVVVGTVQLSNAAAAEIYGLDVDFSAKPTENFTLNGGFIWMHGEYTEFPNAPGYLPTGVGGNVSAAIPDGSGLTTVRTPKFSASLMGDYRVPTSFGDVDLVASYSYNSGYYWDPDNRLKQPSYNLVNASIQWTEPNERYHVRIFAKNLFDEKYLSNGNDTAFGDLVTPAPPQTYGIAFGVNF